MIQNLFGDIRTFGFSSLKDILDVVMVPIAVALLAPWITRRWQDRQRDSRTKTELVAEISELVMTTIMTVYFFKTNPRQHDDDDNSEEQELDRIYKKWLVSTCVVGSKLHAYFPDPQKGDKQIHKKWKLFSDRVNEYYENIRNRGCKNSDWEDGRETLFEEKAEIIAEILTSKITGFRRNTYGKFQSQE